MMTEPVISVGKLGKPHGLSGAFRFLMHRELKSKKRTPNYFLVNKGKSPVPFFIKSLQWNGFNEGFIVFEEISTPEMARNYSGSELLLYEKDANAFCKKEAGQLSYLIGYKVIDETAGDIGLIEDVLEVKGQVLLSVSANEIMIPLVDDFIIEIDKKKRKIVLNLPEGLLDL